MNDERDTPVDPGAPVAEQAVSEGAVQDAVVRATAISDQDAPDAAPVAADVSGQAPAETAHAPAVVAGAEALAEQAHREQAASLDTELDLDTPSAAAQAAPVVDSEPIAAAAPAVVAPVDPVRDGEIRISADHPMAALYMQSPMPPDLKGNRAAGVLIALLGTLAFAALYAGVVSAMIARDFPPSTFLTEGLLPWVTSWGFIAGVVAFFVGLSVLVLVFGRAGWWAYVIFSLFVGVVVWVGTTATFAITESPFGELGGVSGFLATARTLAFTVPTLGAAILAREVAVWFGAWIGARGRRVTAKNTALLAEYDAALAEVRAKQ